VDSVQFLLLGQSWRLCSCTKRRKNKAEIASLLDLNRSVVSRVISRYRQCGSVENRPRTGRPLILSPRAKRVLFKDHKKSRSAPLQEITNTFNLS